MNTAVLAPPVPARAFEGFTAREFIELWPALESTGFRLELEHGTIIRMSPPKLDHSDAQSDFYFVLATAVRNFAPELRVNVELGIIVGFDTVRVPDAVVRDPRSDDSGLILPDMARLVVEVADKSLAKDLGLKAEDYALAGIAEYWVVDVAARVVHLLSEPTPEGYARRSVAPFGTPMRAACLPEAVMFDPG